MKLFEIANPVLIYAKLNSIAQHLMALDIEPTADKLASYTNMPRADIDRTLMWMENKGRAFEQPKRPLERDAHRLLAAYHWWKDQKGERTLQALAKKANLNPSEVHRVVQNNLEGIQHYIPGFKPSWLPALLKLWKNLPDEEKARYLELGYKEVSGEQHGMASADQVSQYLKQNHKIAVERRVIDKYLERPEMQHLDRYRVRGSFGRG
ncbi:hypothetical protein LCGC14_1315220 [marine sediment metagenome]|uniref:Uncharacterized protein n=1 Tax=marine sediment metagenome TaxID=412755 RepID=A0A0F9KL65_9ZZZZ